MPPCSLHHVVKATAESYISLVRPDLIVEPLSVSVPTWISVSVTPVAVAPLASPVLHTLAMSPKPPSARVPPAELLALPPGVAPELELDAVCALLSSRPQPAATSTITRSADAKTRRLCFTLSPLLVHEGVAHPARPVVRLPTLTPCQQRHPAPLKVQLACAGVVARRPRTPERVRRRVE